MKWVGTKNGGLARYDDFTWTVYDTSNSILPSNKIRALAVDNSNNLWIAANYGLVKFEGENWKLYNESNSNLEGNFFERIRFDEKGNLWIIDIEGRLEKFDGVSFIPYDNIRDDLGRRLNFTDFDIDKDGYLWIGTYGNGIVKFRDSTWSILGNSLDSPTRDISAVLVDKNNNKWFGSSVWQGLIKYDNNDWFYYEEKNSGMPDATIREITIEDNFIWLGTYGHGAVKFDGNNWEVFGASYGLPTNSVRYVAVDSNNVKWIATYKGLARLENNNWEVYNNSNSPLPSSDIEVVEVDNDNIIWIGTNNGLVKYDGENWKVFTVENSLLPDNYIISIAVYGQRVFVGTGEGGLVVLNSDTTEIVYNKEDFDLPDNTITSIAIENENSIWFSIAHSGIANISNDAIYYYNEANSLIQSNFISSIKVDKQNNIWLAGSYNGLAKFNGTDWTIFNTDNSEINSNSLTSVQVDKFNNIWVGNYWDQGLNKFDGSNWYSYNKKNELIELAGGFGLNVTSIALDIYNNKWLATDLAGLAVFNENELVNVKIVEKIPEQIFLWQNYPNPFNPTTTISYYNPAYNFVELIIYNLLGEKISVLVNNFQGSGKYQIKFNDPNLSSGVYFYLLKIGEHILSKK